MVDWGRGCSFSHTQIIILHNFGFAKPCVCVCGTARGGTRAFPVSVLNDRAELETSSTSPSRGFKFLPNRANYLSFSNAIAVVQYGVVEGRI
jgi:hypothetical protein